MLIKYKSTIYFSHVINIKQKAASSLSSCLSYGTAFYGALWDISKIRFIFSEKITMYKCFRPTFFIYINCSLSTRIHSHPTIRQ